MRKNTIFGVLSIALFLSLVLSPLVNAEDDEVYIGQRVEHKKFGEGTVIDVEGSGARARVQVSFDYNGTRWLMLNIANLV